MFCENIFNNICKRLDSKHQTLWQADGIRGNKDNFRHGSNGSLGIIVDPSEYVKEIVDNRTIREIKMEEGV
jgi:hypothetical protein